MANATRITELGDLIAHLGPPIPAADIVRRLLRTEVSQNSMCLVDDRSRKAIIFGYFTGNTQDFLFPCVRHVDEPVSNRESSVSLFLFYNLAVNPVDLVLLITAVL